MISCNFFLFNILLTVLCLYLFAYINTGYLRPALINRYRFRLFELRDKLSVLAMNGIIDPNGIEYETLVSLLNKSTKVLGKFSVVDFLTFLVVFHNNRELQTRLDSIIRDLDHKSPEYKEIVKDYFSVMRTVLIEQTRLLVVVLFPILLFFSAIVKVISTTPFEIVTSKKKQVEEIKSDLLGKMRLAAAA